jgi:hypothetical protein
MDYAASIQVVDIALLADVGAMRPALSDIEDMICMDVLLYQKEH